VVGPDADVGRKAAPFLDPLHQERRVLAPAQFVAVDDRVDAVAPVRHVRDLFDQFLVAFGAGRDTTFADGDFTVVHRRRVLQDRVGPVAHVVHEFGRLTPDLPFDVGRLGDDVGRSAAPDLPRVDARPTVFVSGDAIEVPHRRRHRLDGVASPVRLPAGVCGFAGELRPVVGHREETADARDYLTRRVIQADVEGKERVHVVEEAPLSDGFSAADEFLGGLEDDLQRPLEVAVGDGPEDPEADRRVGVVSARVHVAVVLRAKALCCGDVAVGRRLRPGQRVDVHTEGDGGPVAPVERGRHAGQPAGRPVEDLPVDVLLSRTSQPLVQSGLVRHPVPVGHREQVGTEGDLHRQFP